MVTRAREGDALGVTLVPRQWRRARRLLMVFATGTLIGSVLTEIRSNEFLGAVSPERLDAFGRLASGQS